MKRTVSISAPLEFDEPGTLGPDDDFIDAFLDLRRAVANACEPHLLWEAKVLAGIEAALRFAEQAPARARILTFNARRPDGPDNPARFVISYFARELGAGAPPTGPVAKPSDEALVAWIATVVRAHLLSGEVERLPEAAPDLVYMLLAPRLGFAEACRWTELAAARSSGAPS